MERRRQQEMARQIEEKQKKEREELEREQAATIALGNRDERKIKRRKEQNRRDSRREAKEGKREERREAKRKGIEAPHKVGNKKIKNFARTTVSKLERDSDHEMESEKDEGN
ncbi:hypothetical protein OSTOST_18955 [Ostertagia ostertagi]